jgi:hypothetical protein
MITYILVQPQNPPPRDPQQGGPVPIAGGWILIIAGALYGLYYFYKMYRLLKKK